VSELLLTGASESIRPRQYQLDSFYYVENDKLQMLRLPYFGSTLEMVILLPKASHTMQEIRQGLSPDVFSKLLQISSRQRVKVSVPKVKLESTLSNITQTLQRMGLTDAFTDKANFSNMTNSLVEISGIFQKAFIQVDEKGTVAAAATTTVMFGGAPPSGEPVEFNANRPFVFMLYDTKTGYILFMGHVVHP